MRDSWKADGVLTACRRTAAIALLVGGCSGVPAPRPAPAPAPTPAPVEEPAPVAGTAPASSPPAAAASVEPPQEILAELRRWDASTPESRRAAAEWVGRRMPEFAFLRMETFSCGGPAHEVGIYRHVKTGLEFVLVPVGAFEMGLPAADVLANENDRQHRVRLTKPFLIARTECTQSAWDRYDVPDNRSARAPDLPIDSVTWEQCDRWCRLADLSLPTNAQWEYACRAGATGRWCFGDAAGELPDFAWSDVNSDGRPHPVGRKKPNAFGLLDVHGNVEEWCADWCAPHGAAEATDPAGPDDAGAPLVDTGAVKAKAHVLCGGSWYECPPAGCRWMGPIGFSCSMDGFRPAKNVPMN